MDRLATGLRLPANDQAATSSAPMKRFDGKTALVTGGAGFIGSHLVEALLHEGASVRVLDNLATGHRSNLPATQDSFAFVEGDIRNAETCGELTAGVDVIFHQAALASVPRSLKTPAETFRTNVQGTVNVLTAARDHGIRRIVYASSSSVYGDSRELPKTEGREGSPLSPYAMSKHMDEELSRIYRDCFNLEPVGLRYFNIYGPRQDPKGPYAAVIPKFFEACFQGKAPVIFGDGTQSRDFTFVSDVVEANLSAALTDNAVAGEAYNIGAEGRTTVNELAQLIGELTGSSVSPIHEPPRPGDVAHSNADVSKAAAAFGYTPTVEIREGLQRTLEAYRP